MTGGDWPDIVVRAHAVILYSLNWNWEGVGVVIGVLSPTVETSYFLLFALHLLIILSLPCFHVLLLLFLQSVSVFFGDFEVEQNFVTSQSSLTTSTSVSGLLPSTVYLVTVTGMYNESGRASLYRTDGIKTDMEKGAGPR